MLIWKAKFLISSQEKPQIQLGGGAGRGNIIKGIAITSFSKTSERRQCLEDPLSEIMGLLENLRAGSLRRLIGGSSF